MYFTIKFLPTASSEFHGIETAGTTCYLTGRHVLGKVSIAIFHMFRNKQNVKRVFSECSRKKRV